MAGEFRLEKTLFAEAGSVVRFEESLYPAFVLFSVQGAGSVEEQAAGLELAPCVFQDGSLKSFSFV